MSLKLWMPLTEDMRNLGLYGTNPGASGGTFENSGKLGKCLKTSGAIDTGLPYTEWNYSTDSITMCCWVKFNLTELRTALPSSIVTSSATTPTGNLLGYNSYNGLALAWSVNNVYSSGLVNNISLTGYYRTGSNLRGTSSYTVPFDTWTHVALVFNKSIKKILLYINGSVYGSAGSLPDSTPVLQQNFKINFGAVYGGNGPGRSIPCRINDVRVYDLALTLQEIKEISKGLILHYPLRGPYIKNLNPYILSTENYTISDYSNRTSSSIINGVYHVNGYLSASSADTLFSATTKNFITLLANTDYYLSFYCKSQSANALSFGTSGLAYTGLISNSNTRHYPSNYVDLGTSFDGFVVLKIRTSSDTLYKINLGFDGPNIFGVGSFIEFHSVMLSLLEPSDYVPYEYNNNIVYDSSGYNNNGTITGTLTTSTDTPRYDKCSVFSNDAYISAGKIHTALLDEYTMSAWVNPSTDDTSYHNFISCTQNGGTLLRIENKQFIHLAYLNNAYAINTGTTTITPNTWYHVVGTFKKGVGVKLYVNGVKESEVSNSGTLTYNSTIDLMIGAEPGSNNLITSGYSFSGKISDVRLYATALSDADILDLYKESAYINYKGDVGCYLFYEDADSQITKTGQVLSEEFEEISDLSDGVAKVYELKIECNQLIEI